MAKILLGITGSVAAIKTPLVYEALCSRGHEVKIIATQAALYFFDPTAIATTPGQGRNHEAVILDEDEWPGRHEGRRYQRDDAVLHIELRRWADLFAVAPLDANTLAKLASGMADNCLTCVWRAWDVNRPVVLAPAMNTLMWQHPATIRHLRNVASDLGAQPPIGLTLDDLINWINAFGPHLRVVGPESRMLACGDIGMGAMSGPENIATTVDALLLAQHSQGLST